MNDFHARFEETSPSSSSCKDTNCIGGFSRAYNTINSLLDNRPNAIFLNAGDNFQGTLWYNVFKWNVTQYFLNKLPTDAYTLGNHEFDDDVEGVVPFIKSLNAPVVVANIDDSEEPTIQGTYQKSIIIERAGRKIGIIGVIASDTSELSSTGKLKFTDEAEAINKEASRLVENEDCKIIIVVSHSGLDVDKVVATKLVPHVNLIVGGHSHTLLYNGEPPNNAKPVGPYPVVIDRENGRKVLIVQASSYTKYIGNLTVFYNNEGDIINWDGNPIYLSNEIPQDDAINQELNVWKQQIDEFANRILGTTNVLLSRDDCYSAECNLGNFITDAMVDYYAGHNEDQSGWSHAAIAFMNSGGIRTNIPKGDITYADLLSTSPFESTIDVGELTGEQIKSVLEYSVNSTIRYGFRQFLQFSGLRVVFDLNQPVGSRVVDLKVKCRLCDIPQFEDYKPEEYYRVTLNSFLAKGGDGYSVIKDNLQNREIGPVDIELFEGYVKKMSPITQGLDGRMKFV
ncbi:uncharacterized protein CBL_20048 [Carabus blaptoides fortunei]